MVLIKLNECVVVSLYYLTKLSTESLSSWGVLKEPVGKLCCHRQRPLVPELGAGPAGQRASLIYVD